MLQIQRTIRALQKLSTVVDVGVIDQFTNLLAKEIMIQRASTEEYVNPTDTLQDATLRDVPNMQLTDGHMVMADSIISRTQHTIAIKNFAKLNKLKAKPLKEIPNVPHTNMVNQLPQKPKRLDQKRKDYSNKDPQDASQRAMVKGSRNRSKEVILPKSAKQPRRKAGQGQ